MSDHMPKFTSVTTFNLKEQNYGIEMLESFYKFWPKDCCLYAFLEDYSNLDDTTSTISLVFP